VKLFDYADTLLRSPSGRGFPDVAAQGTNFQVVVGGKITSVGGTSASAPVCPTQAWPRPIFAGSDVSDQTFASVVSLLNDARIAAGISPLGFLNPWLYTTGFNGLNDIVGGNNPGCGTAGFTAVKGWDPVTGLGTPNFGLLKDIALDGTTV